MTIQHNTITGTDLHEPKGIAAAAANLVYVANGSASGAWSTLAAASIASDAITTVKILDANVTTAKILDSNVTTAKIANANVTNAKMIDDAITIEKTNMPRGGCYFYNLVSPYTLSYGAATQKINPTTIARSVANYCTEGTDARLHYTGAASQFVKVDWDVSIYQASGTKKITLAIHKNGTLVAGSESVLTTATGVIYNAAGSTIVSATTNDYFALYAFNTDGSGDMLFNKVGLSLQGI